MKSDLFRFSSLILALSFLLVLPLLAGCSENTASPEEPGVQIPSYTFFAAGHTYGRPPTNNEGLHPPFITAMTGNDPGQFSFGVLTGDIVWYSSEQDWDEVEADLQIFPNSVHFCVGNHDMSNRDLFTSRYGSTWYAFQYQEDLFIVLDGELDPCNITGEQLAFLTAELDQADFKRVFLFVHKLIWVQSGTPWYALRPYLNSSSGYNFNGNFWTVVEPMLQATEVPVYLIAGDIGITAAMPLFWEPVGNLTLIASGMGGNTEENFLAVHVSADSVGFSAIRLDGLPLELGSLEAYNLEHYSTK
jgi:Calcineurin-like phosphoesterase